MNCDQSIINFSLIRGRLIQGFNCPTSSIVLLFQNQLVIATCFSELTVIADILGLRADPVYVEALFAEFEVPVDDYHAILIADFFDQLNEGNGQAQAASTIVEAWQSQPISERFECGLLVLAGLLQGRLPPHLRNALNQYQATRAWAERNYLFGECFPWMFCRSINKDFHLLDSEESGN